MPDTSAPATDSPMPGEMLSAGAAQADAQRVAARAILAALKAWQTFGQTRPSAEDIDNGCTIPIKEFRRAQELMRDAFDAAEAAGIKAEG